MKKKTPAKEKQTQDFVPRPCSPPTHNDLVCCCHSLLGTYADKLAVAQTMSASAACSASRPIVTPVGLSRCASAWGGLQFRVCLVFVSALPTTDNRKGCSFGRKLRLHSQRQVGDKKSPNCLCSRGIRLLCSAFAVLLCNRLYLAISRCGSCIRSGGTRRSRCTITVIGTVVPAASASVLIAASAAVSSAAS